MKKLAARTALFFLKHIAEPFTRYFVYISLEPFTQVIEWEIACHDIIRPMSSLRNKK